MIEELKKIESAQNGRNGAHGLNCKIFVDYQVIFEIFVKNYPRKKFYVSQTILKFWQFLNVQNLNFDWQFLRNGQKYWQFFVIFDQVDTFYFLVEFEVDEMRLKYRKWTKGRSRVKMQYFS